MTEALCVGRLFCLIAGVTGQHKCFYTDPCVFYSGSKFFFAFLFILGLWFKEQKTSLLLFLMLWGKWEQREHSRLNSVNQGLSSCLCPVIELWSWAFTALPQSLSNYCGFLIKTWTTLKEKNNIMTPWGLVFGISVSLRALEMVDKAEGQCAVDPDCSNSLFYIKGRTHYNIDPRLWEDWVIWRDNVVKRNLF